MIWLSPHKGTTKIVTKFLLFPVAIGQEARWLEWATIIYECQGWDEGWTGWIWKAVKFVDKE